MSVLLAGPAVAMDSGQAEWAQTYDSVARLSVTRSTTPLLSPRTLSATEQAIEQYRRIVANGGWGRVPGAAGSLKLGASGPAVAALRKRLIVTGDLDPAATTSGVYDSYVEAAVRRFQARHGLIETGVVNQSTLDAMNVPADYRLKQLETNIVRLRSFSANLGDRFVTANIPAALVETVENDTVATRHIAGVGKIDRQSPVMQTRALDVDFNPYWTVPASIIRKDLIPKMQQDPNYLRDNHIHIFDKNNQEVQPEQINWHSLEATNYRFREDPSTENSLGVVRININNPYGVYMHDTPAKGVFGDDFRFVSSGCMRLQNVRDYVAWLLKNQPGWDRDRIDATIASGERLDVKIEPPVNVYWVYITAWGTPEGVVQFREDIYQRDGFSPTAARAAPAPTSAVRAQAERFDAAPDDQ
ncbi:murein L,D-transpeptidase YcbB/YkuD [Rhodoblastus acidophilus]|uniref:L,D-transpeptidase family protein n=1 Tax=Rhodoblastus acidophilus TaxID=1074 RepID=UPI002225A6EF|nr:L,D-transpeptidase family protein [Rhodoblastus acidophilus]MCW2284868.1 murein L,D-transpeptidase YcbB/YkuD [Rhodoblastus acidophilus]MCW2333842.1 murein L,D-transpeptidase YcbB/YkuD [Rhodoblastus acidophilus]